ncbi:unnamed protein product, partial [Symbiodinium sp. CCMP2456]
MTSTAITIKKTIHSFTPSPSSKRSVGCSSDATSAVVVASSPVSKLLLPSDAGGERDVVVCEVEKVLCEELDDDVGLPEVVDVRVSVEEEVSVNDVEEDVMLLEVEELLDVRVNVEDEVSVNDVEENVMLLEVRELLDVRVNVVLVVAEVERLLEVVDVAALLLAPPAGPLPTMAYGEFFVAKDGINK